LGGSPHESDEMGERFVLASPVAHVSSKTPPTLLIHGGQDQLVRSENMTRLAGRLKESNAPHKTLFIPYAQHGFDYNFNGFGAQIAQSEILDFLRENLQAD
jgi:dipeptidyl aminopeptidase/acylaminoacyl peptidase